MRGDLHIGLYQRNLGVVEQIAKEGPDGVHLAQACQRVRVLRQQGIQPAAQPVPSGQVDPALHPGEHPGDGADLRHLLPGRLRGGRACEPMVSCLISSNGVAPRQKSVKPGVS